MYTANEAADLIGIGRSTIYDLIAQGEIRAERIGRRVFFTAATLEAVLGERPPPPSHLGGKKSQPDLT